VNIAIRKDSNTVFAQCIDALLALGIITHSHGKLAMM